MESARRLTILFVPRSSIGHINSCIGVAELLHFRSHQIVFAVDQSFKGYFKRQGFREEIIEKELSSVEQRDPGESIRKLYLQNGLFHDHSELEKVRMWIECATLTTKYQDEQLAKIIDRIKPDVIVVDWFIAPSIFNSGIPWVLSISQQILTLIDDPRTPPRWVGLPADDPSQWAKYRQLLKDDFDFMTKKFYCLFDGVNPFTGNSFIESPYLNIYNYPLELDYTDQRPLSSKWHRIDSFIRIKEDDFVLPEKLANQKGKLIYFGMGSLVSANVQMMKRFMNLIADLPFRFIVSKGFYGDEYDLPPNCWGDKMVSQIKVLPLVDLIICHGGNNTVTESFYFGKPMIIMPVYMDQFDNAQRVHEKGFGLRLNAYRCTKEELTNAINKLIYDDDLALKMKKISQRIQTEVGRGKVAQLIENLVDSFK